MMSDELTAELDAAHQRARVAFMARDGAAYMAMFSPQLEYKRADGQTINRDQLARDVQSQMAGLTSAGSSYKRLGLVVEGECVIETLVQDAFLETVVFFIFKRRWTIQRTGRYHWTKTQDGWRIVKVEVLKETAI
jgi:hypothetical protein